MRAKFNITFILESIKILIFVTLLIPKIRWTILLVKESVNKFMVNYIVGNNVQTGSKVPLMKGYKRK